MSEDDVLMTPGGYQKLKKELDYLSNKGRREMAEKIRRARSLGDLSENAEFDAAKEKQGKMESRIAQMKGILQRAQVVLKENVIPGEVTVGSRVRITDNATKESFSYVVVSPMEANPSDGKISYRSPVGKAIFGKKEGDEVTVRLPAGKAIYTIDEVEWIGEQLQ